ncbi:hypothetical protein FRC06_005135 [Ceratobasidium sp. 370]|nr:hypothetical protein FRC06_005135 [Ceratobasidium sp. 370]
MTSYAHDLEHWQHILPRAQDDHILGVTQQPTTPTATNPFSFSRRPEGTDIMDDLSFDISREVKMIFIGRRGLEKVAMKRLRIATIGDEDVVRKRFIRECEVWRKLKHPNVLEFYGIVKHAASLFMPI